MDFLKLLAQERDASRKTRQVEDILGIASKPGPYTSLFDNDIVYIENVFTDEAADRLWGVLSKQQFLQLSGRELLNIGGVPHPNGTILEEVPSWLEEVFRIVVATDAYGEMPNQALINRYSSGQGISAHQDGPNFKPQAAVLSLGSYATICFMDNEKIVFEKSLAPKSMLVLRGVAYERWSHKVLPVKEQRISITIRNVANVDLGYKWFDKEEEMERRRIWWTNAISEK